MSLRKIILLFSLFLCVQLTNAQKKTDSLKKLISTEKVATKKVDLIFQLAQSFRRKSTDSAIYYAKESLGKASEINYNFGIANANIGLAWSYYTRSNHEKAKSLCHEAIKYYKKAKKNGAHIGSCYRLLAAISTKEKKSEECLRYLLRARDLYKNINTKDNEVKTLVLNDIAYLYLEMDNYIMAMKYLNESIATAKENDQTATLADCYNILATITSRQNDFDKALEHYNTSKNIYLKRNDLLGIAICNTNLGITYYRKKSYLKAIEFSEIAKKQATDIQFNLGIMENLVYLGKSHIKLSNTVAAEGFLNDAQKISVPTSDVVMAKSELANKQGFFHKSIKLLENHISENKKILFPKEKIELYKTLSKTYEDSKNYKKALDTKNDLLKIQDSINSINKTIQINVLQAEFDYKKVQADLKNKEIELQVAKDKAKASRFINILLTIAGLLLMSITTLIFLRRKHLRKTRKEIWKTKQELQETKQKQSDGEISFKNRQITDFALHIYEKNELLLDIKNKIKSFTLTENIKNKKLNDLILFLNNNLEQNKEKVALYSVADNTKDAFYHKLRELYPKLNEKETRVAAYVRLNLASKQIGIQLNITKASVDNYRYSLRKKMEVPKEVFLYDFIKKI